MNPDHESLLTGAVIGAAIEVHRQLGPGADEPAYEAALSQVLSKQGIHHECQKPLPLIYKDETVDCGYRLDILVEGRLPLELKAVALLTPIHDAQILTYMRLGAFKLGLILNFEVAVLREGIRRRILSNPRRPSFPKAGRVEESESDLVVAELLRSAVDVYRALGRGLLRSSYEACLCHELTTRGVPFKRRFEVPLRFADHELGYTVEVPLLLAGRIPVTCLSVAELTPLHEATLLARLRQARMKLGYLINFNAPELRLGIRKLVLPSAAGPEVA